MKPSARTTRTALLALPLLFMACSQSHNDKITQTTDQGTTYETVVNPSPSNVPDKVGTLYDFTGPDAKNLTFLADDWNTDVYGPTKINSTTYTTDGTRKCVNLSFNTGAPWESVLIYVVKDGGVKGFDFSQVKNIALDVKADWNDTDIAAWQQSFSVGLVMVNGAEFMQSAAVTKSWTTVKLKLPEPGSVITTDQWGNKVQDGWTWANWTPYDVFTPDQIAQIIIGIGPAASPNPYQVSYSNLALSN